MTEYKKESSVLKELFSKRLVHSGEQYVDFKVTKINDNISIDISSSQQTKGYISGDANFVKSLIKELEEILTL